ncbi:hypothetical protein SKAU_G00202340, partial [Synaphobranchus kaupii]
MGSPPGAMGAERKGSLGCTLESQPSLTGSLLRFI